MAMSKIEAAAKAIARAVRANPAISRSGLNDEIERGDINGWLHISAVRACNFSEWTAAMGVARDAVFGEVTA